MDEYELMMQRLQIVQSGAGFSKPQKSKKAPKSVIAKNVPVVIPKTEIAKALAAIQPETQNFKVFTDPPAFGERRTKFALGAKINAHLKGLYTTHKKELAGHFLQIQQTPMAVVHSMIHYVEYTKNAKTLVFCNVEFVLYLVKVLGVDVNTIFFVDDCIDMADETGKIASIKAGMLSELVNFPASNIVNQRDLEKIKMKFDYVVGNPPYDGAAALHQKFFVKAFNLINETGTVAFIQPATPYFNKKNVRKKTADLEMVEIIKDYAQTVQFCDEKVFEGADVGTKLAITVASKKHNNGRINVQYMNGTKIVSNFDGINQLQVLPEMYFKIREKFEKLCGVNGSFLSVVNTDDKNKAYLAKIRGNVNGAPDFYTLVPNKVYRDKHFTCGDHDFGIPLANPEHLSNCYDYCETFFARFALALLKINPNSHRGELALIPLVDFSRTYTEDELFDMAGFTAEERDTIMNTLPDYHNRRK